jgi:hypothetical protein
LASPRIAQFEKAQIIIALLVATFTACFCSSAFFFGDDVGGFCDLAGGEDGVGVATNESFFIWRLSVHCESHSTMLKMLTCWIVVSSLSTAAAKEEFVIHL